MISAADDDARADLQFCRYGHRMLPTLRTKLLIALSLTCVPVTLACKKQDDEATGVENEGIKKKKPKPDPPKKKDKTWLVEGSPTAAKPCGYARFCTTARLKDEFPSDSTPLRNECGGTVKIPKEAVITGFSEDHNASFDELLTKEERDKGEPDVCCYGYQTGPCGKGRPLRDGDGFVLAPEIATRGWGDVDVAAAAREVRDVDVFVTRFRELARLEHGSVAAFAVVSLELLALGAPADLIERAHVAALDEIRHARVCWSLIEALTGEAVGPGPMTFPERKPIDRERILIDTIVEGCIGETLGALKLAEEAADAPPALAAIYRVIADEEASHAELAFRIVKFLIQHEPRLAGLALAVTETSATGAARAVVLPVMRELTSQYELVPVAGVHVADAAIHGV
jgi:hypothetical protein